MENYIKLPDKFIFELENSPESGMGYQKINIYLSNGDIVKNLIVLNSEVIKVNDNLKIDVDKIIKIELIK